MADNHVDLAIIGGGFVGLTTAALAALKYPQLTLLVLERSMLGHGSSFYSAAFSAPLSKSQISHDLIHRGNHVLKQLSAAMPLNLIKKNCVYILHKDNEKKLHDRYEAKDLSLIDNTVLTTSTLSAILKPASTYSYFLGSDSGFHVKPLEYINALQSFIGRTQQIYDNTPVNHIRKIGDILEINCDHRVIYAKRAVIAIGPWLLESTFTHHFPLQMQLKNKKVAALKLNIKPKPSDPAVILVDDDAFFLPMVDEGYWLFSFPSADWHYHPGDNMSLTDNDIFICEQILSRYECNFSDAICGAKIFCDAYSDNREFSLIDADSSVTIVNGASGSGFRFSYGIADKILEKISV